MMLANNQHNPVGQGCIETFPVGSDLSRIKDSLFRIHAEWNLASQHWEQNYVSVASQSIDNLLMTLIDIPPVYSERSPELIKKYTDDRYCLIMALGEGRHLFSQDNREINFEQGMITVWSMARPAIFRTYDRYRLFSIIVPGRDMRANIPDIDDHCARPINVNQGEGFLLASYMKALSETMARGELLSSSRLANASLQLATCAFGTANNQHDRTAHHQEIKHFILNNLQHPSLSPRYIADALNMSLSQVHRAFRNDEFTVSAWIRYQRLQSCRQMLSDPTFKHLSITEICYRWGFNDSAHFCRAFQKEFGVRPSDIRRGRATLPEPKRRQLGDLSCTLDRS